MFKKIILSAMFAIALAFPISAAAADIVTSDNDASFAASKTSKNLYIFGQNAANIDGTVSKDLTVFASNINVNSPIGESIFGAGNNINIKENVGNSVRVAGSNIIISKSVDGDVMAAGQNITLQQNSSVRGDLFAAGTSINLNGHILGSVKIAGESVKISGTIDGDVVLKNVTHLTLENGAKIGGKLEYYSPNTANISSGASIAGGVNYHELPDSYLSAKSLKYSEFWWLIAAKFLSALVATLILIFIFKTFTKIVVSESYSNFWSNLGRGLFVMIIVPIAIILLFALQITSIVAIVLLLTYILFLIIAGSFTAILLGSLLLKWIRRSAEYDIDWKSGVFGVLLATLLSFIPVFGWIVLFLLFLVSLGMISFKTWDTVIKRR